MKKLIGAYTEYAKAPKMELQFASILHVHFPNTSLRISSYEVYLLDLCL